MVDPNLWKSWQVTTSYLNRGFAFVSNDTADKYGKPIAGLVNDFREYIENNELELALDALEMLGDRCIVPGGFWRSLENAATQMGLNARAEALHSKMLDTLDRGLQNGG